MPIQPAEHPNATDRSWIVEADGITFHLDTGEAFDSVTGQRLRFQPHGFIQPMPLTLTGENHGIVVVWNR